MSSSVISSEVAVVHSNIILKNYVFSTEIYWSKTFKLLPFYIDKNFGPFFYIWFIFICIQNYFLTFFCKILSSDWLPFESLILYVTHEHSNVYNKKLLVQRQTNLKWNLTARNTWITRYDVRIEYECNYFENVTYVSHSTFSNLT